MFKVIIAGSRNFNDYDLVRSAADELLSDFVPNIEIVSGGARGADRLGECYANEKGYKVTIFPANWDLYGKSAGYRRNVEMGNYADALIAFWDGLSKGTKHMIDIAKDLGLKIAVININS